MKELVEPIKSIFQLYCHVEDYVIYDLDEDIKSPAWNVDISLIKSQIEEVFESSDLYLESINKITGNEFENNAELKEWLIPIKDKIFLL
ncbi:MAG: hypothetical protein KAZ18_04535 [Acinetobacter sp.]|nr:hypothetical protein [Acinetobacter sp.]